MFRAHLQSGLVHVGLALREPEEFALRWHGHEGLYSWRVFVALALTAIAGTLTYGLTMGLLGGPRAVALGCAARRRLGWPGESPCRRCTSLTACPARASAQAQRFWPRS